MDINECSPARPRIGRIPALCLAGAGSAALASACCVGPVALGALGIGAGAAALLTSGLRPVLLASAVALFAAAAYATHCRACCEPAARNRFVPLVLVAATVLVSGLVLARAPGPSGPADPRGAADPCCARGKVAPR